MEPRRTIAAAVSVALVGATSAFAVTRGVFDTAAAGRAAGLPAMVARLAPQTVPVPTATTASTTIPTTAVSTTAVATTTTTQPHHHGGSDDGGGSDD